MEPKAPLFPNLVKLMTKNLKLTLNKGNKGHVKQPLRRLVPNCLRYQSNNENTQNALPLKYVVSLLLNDRNWRTKKRQRSFQKNQIRKKQNNNLKLKLITHHHSHSCFFFTQNKEKKKTLKFSVCSQCHKLKHTIFTTNKIFLS